MESMEQTLQILSNATGTNTELLNIKVTPGVGDIVVQLDVFDEQHEERKTKRQSSSSSLNVNSHHDVFQAIMEQVTRTPQEITFLNILQHLLSIDATEVLNGVIWNVVEKLVHRATQLDNSEEAECLLNASVRHIISSQNCQVKAENKEADTKTALTLTTEVPSPPTPPLSHPVFKPLPPPIPPPPPLPTANALNPTAPLPPPGIPPPPPPILVGATPVAPANQIPTLLPQQNTPMSSKKLKTFNWTKIPPQKIMNKLNIWTIMANDRQYKCVELIDFKGIEGLFSLQTTNKINNDTKDVVDGAASSADKNDRKLPKHIHLLDAQQSLKINIFLSQFKGFNSNDIIQLIRSGDHKVMNLEKLKDLIKFFQKDEEIMLLKTFNGDRQRLASAEKFLISMMEVPNFKLRIECMMLKEEFALNATYLEPCIDSIIKAGNNLMKSKTLQEILSIIIIIGNFLNSGGYAGNAAGIKLSSLNNLTDIKANKTGMHLLHLIAMEVKRYNPELLDLSNELSFMQNVSQLTNDQIEKDIKDMEFALDNIEKQIYLPTTDQDIQQQMNEFLKNAKDKMDFLRKQVEELKSLRVKMADFFCEEVSTFKINECFEIFHKFCKQFTQALKENEKRQQLEIQAHRRLKQKEEQLAGKALNPHPKQVKTAAHIPSKLRRAFKESIKDMNTNFEMKANKDDDDDGDDDLMRFLQTSSCKRFGRKGIRKLSGDKKPGLLDLNLEREREQCPLFLEKNTENILHKNENNMKTPCLDEQKSAKLGKKSWNRLMENYKESQLREICLTPDTAPRRESLQIFIRSNSMMDSKLGQLNKQPAVIKIIKTPLPKTCSVFNFSENDIQTLQAAHNRNVAKNFDYFTCKDSLDENPLNLEIANNCKETSCENNTPSSTMKSPIEIRHPRMNFKRMNSIIEQGCRYSSINEKDLKTTIKKLRTPTVEKTQFCFSPVCELPHPNSFAFNHTTPKRIDCNEDQSPKLLNRSRENKVKKELNPNEESKQIEVQKPFDKIQNENIKEQNIKDYPTDPFNFNNNVKVQNKAECCSPAQHSLLQGSDSKSGESKQETCKIMFPKLKKLVTQTNNSQRLIAVTPLQQLQTTTEPLAIPQNTVHFEKPNSESNSNEPIHKITSRRENSLDITNNIVNKNVNKETIKISEQVSPKKNVSKNFVNRLQNKFRALTPLASQPATTFHSYINLQDDLKIQREQRQTRNPK